MHYYLDIISTTIIANFRITEYESCDRLSSDIQAQIAKRNQKPRLSDDYSKLSATVRVRLNQFSNELNQLNSKIQNGKL